MPIRLSGINSGLDTDSIVKALVTSYSNKKTKYEKAQTKLGWTQEAWKSLNTKVYSFYTNISSMRFTSAYNLKKTSVSDSTKASVKAGANAPSGTQSLKIKQMAKAGYMTGAQIKASGANTTLAQLGYTGGDAKIDVKIGDETKSITLSASSKISDVVTELKNAGLEANYDTNYKRFYISAKATGADSDFTITGGNLSGASALYTLGIAYGGESDSTNPYSDYVKLYGGDDATTKANILNAVKSYNDYTSEAANKKAQSNNVMGAISYGIAYADLQDFYKAIGTENTAKLKTLEGLGSSRNSSLIITNDDGTYTTYTKTISTDTQGNAVYKSSDGKSYLSVEETYVDKSGNTYKKSSDGTYTNVDQTGPEYDGSELTKQVTYHTATESSSYVADGIDGTFTQKDADTYVSDKDGTEYVKREDGKYYATGKTEDSENGIEITLKTEYTAQTDNISNVESASEAYTAISEEAGEKEFAAYQENLATAQAFESTIDEVLTDDDEYSVSSLVSKIQKAYSDNGGKEGVNSLISGNGNADSNFAKLAETLENQSKTAENNAKANEYVKDLAAIDDTSDEYDAAIDEFIEKVNTAYTISKNSNFNSGINKINGQDAKIELNGVEYTGNSNSFTINGLTIEALAETGDNAISIATSTDTQGIYDKIKDFLTEYNNIINEMTKLYNAESAGSYEPLSDDEKEEMSDSEIEKWETKIKDSLLRRDTTLGGVMTAMQSAMSSVIEIGDKRYSLASFGIQTLGYLNSADNEQNAYHIDGDEDDSNTSGKTDKLMAAINEDPDAVMQFMQKLTTNLYTAIGDKMKGTTLSSAFTIYNDKQMTTEYSNYTKLIKEWETKLSDKEEYYYKKFSKMESAMATLNSTQSSLSSYFSS